MKTLLNTIIAISLLTLSNPALAALAKYETKIINHKFEPAIIEVPANQKFQLIVKNEDTTAEEFESHDLRKEKFVSGGKSIKINIKALTPGEYNFFGEFHPKTAQGTIIVK